MDYNGNISDNPFLKQDNAAKRLIRRRPIIIRDTDTNKSDTGFKMKSSDVGGKLDSPNSDLEYGPGIVEKLRAKFSKMSGAQKEQEKSTAVQSKKYSSCDDLLSESDNIHNVLKSSHVQSHLQRRTSRSISDILSNEEIEKPFCTREIESKEAEETKTISQLRRRFEKNGEQVAKMRFARDPVQLISKFQPDLLDEWRSNMEISKSPVPHTTSALKGHTNSTTTAQKPNEAKAISDTKNRASNVLKVLNDGELSRTEPEFVQIARRLRRFQPEIHNTNVSTNTVTNNAKVNNSFHSNNINNNVYTNTSSSSKTTTAASLPPLPTYSAPARPATLSMWQRRQPEIPQYSEAAKIIRDNCDIVVLPPDPHSARMSKQPIPSLGIVNNRLHTLAETSPPPEEPKPNALDCYSQFRKTVVDISSSDRSSAVNSVFKYDNTSAAVKSPINTNLWKPAINSPTMSSESTMSSPTTLKLPLFSRKVNDVGPKSMITSSTTSANVVSISVKAPVSNRIYANYDNSDEVTTESIRSSVPLKPPITYSPSYTSTSLNSVSLSSKYLEEMSKTSQQHQQQPINLLTSFTSKSGLLSPRKKPYGDNVTILKSEPTNETQKLTEPFATNNIAQQDESDDNSDGDSRDGNGSYDITPIRPNSLNLQLARIANEDELGGDGNVISRSLLSLVAEEDLPDFLVALNEKPIKYVVVEESDKPSTSSILRSRDVIKEGKTPKKATRIRFCTENPLAYAYLDENTATRSLQWDDGTVVEYSYFKELEATEEATLTHNDPTLALIEQWEQQIANDNIQPLAHDLTFSDSRIESPAVSSAY